MTEAAISKDTRVQLGLALSAMALMAGLIATEISARYESRELFGEAMRKISENQALVEVNGERFSAGIERTNESIARTNQELVAIREALQGLDGRAVLRVNLLYWIEQFREMNKNRKPEDPIIVPTFPNR